MKNKIEDLRNHLFETLEALKDKDKPMEIDRARAICEVSQTIINTAKAETEHLKVVGGKSASDFIQVEQKPLQPEQPQPRLVRRP